MKEGKVMRSLAQTKKMLKRLEEGWNPKYWIFVASGTFMLMRINKDGERAMTEDGGVDPDYEVESFDDIPSDGGDW